MGEVNVRGQENRDRGQGSGLPDHRTPKKLPSSSTAPAPPARIESGVHIEVVGGGIGRDGRSIDLADGGRQRHVDGAVTQRSAVAGARLVLTSGAPIWPVAPGWMCARMAGRPRKPLRLNGEQAVPAPITPPLASRGTLKLIVTLPRPFASGPITAAPLVSGAQLEVKTIGPVFDGPVGLPCCRRIRLPEPEP